MKNKIEITEDAQNYIDDLIKKLQPLGLASASRTGVVAMTKGSEIYKQH